ncbi:TPA: hypothetical protein LWH57_002813 [Listeria monocytogenes]|uniref:hypothetical protein n=1 Tax=Listeria monocytogenes TaxID=1639 RepID=UPI000766A204|nr:hypothetical protein [Listeria monocytogenes]EAE2878222.1 hypothetical protein [Listeria monocytogenes]EAE2881178.1 hypothetical protein [Listeria monocytogenes]EAE2884104.1 hypothetical protein [Listeria monocytogenes]EAE3426500.1 hypothetical protein [Listeria monocytogenes]EAE4561972.1 hypothetical protein [Listeria monocytogenes]
MKKEAAERVWNRLNEAETTVYNTVAGKNITGYDQNKIEKILKQEGISFEEYGEYHRARVQKEEAE